LAWLDYENVQNVYDTQDFSVFRRISHNSGSHGNDKPAAM